MRLPQCSKICQSAEHHIITTEKYLLMTKDNVENKQIATFVRLSRNLAFCKIIKSRITSPIQVLRPVYGSSCREKKTYYIALKFSSTARLYN